jgi:hypothetical protein
MVIHAVDNPLEQVHAVFQPVHRLLAIVEHLVVSRPKNDPKCFGVEIER